MSSMTDQLNADMKEAMKKKEKKALTVIRGLKSSIQNEKIKLGRELSSEDELTVVSREMKQRKESLQEFESAGREDLAEQVRTEIDILQKYMPEQLSAEQLQSIVHETIEQVGASSPADMGKVMGAIMPKVKGKADGSEINKMVKQALQK
jgi:uncharacterized protein